MVSPFRVDRSSLVSWECLRERRRGWSWALQCLRSALKRALRTFLAASESLEAAGASGPSGLSGYDTTLAGSGSVEGTSERLLEVAHLRRLSGFALVLGAKLWSAPALLVLEQSSSTPKATFAPETSIAWTEGCVKQPKPTERVRCLPSHKTCSNAFSTCLSYQAAIHSRLILDHALSSPKVGRGEGERGRGELTSRGCAAVSWPVPGLSSTSAPVLSRSL